MATNTFPHAFAVLQPALISMGTGPGGPAAKVVEIKNKARAIATAAVAKGTGIEVVRIPPRSPDLNPICERFLGSVRRECLDHVVILNEAHLRRVLEEFALTYFNKARPHQGIGQRIPAGGGVGPSSEPPGKVVALPVLGGLHHDYRRAA